ncbi:ATP-binding protein [Enterococcus sp. DIV0800]|uniref:ATP-binding protein n=1 Tax=unclassified Enterococcus TaxID=2608891 RepID=UPI003D2FD2E9
MEITFRIAEKGTGSYRNKKAMEYLEDCGFFEEFFGKNDIYKENHAFRDTTLPIRTLGVDQSFSWRHNVLKRWLQTSTGRDLEFSGIQVGVEEIFNNIADHSNRNIGCVFGQYFPNNNNRLVITISDFGLGIPTVMRQKYGDMKDHELVLKALEEGVSTESTPGNRGAGLPNIMKSLTSHKIGTVHILTNYAKIIIQDGKVRSAATSGNFYPGTFFEIELNVNNEKLYEGEEEEEFEW